MVFGLGTKKVQKETKANTKTQHANTSQADEAAEMLKKMEAKKDAGDCPFCQLGPYETPLRGFSSRGGVE